jgi:ABC-type branched-subunit amino acid transport system substrate-binding protein
VVRGDLVPRGRRCLIESPTRAVHRGGRRRRARALVPLVVLALVAVSCSNHDDAAGTSRDGTPASTAAGGGGGAAGTFGTMGEAVCGPGSASASSAQGVSDTAIKVGVVGDAGSTLVPDLNKELIDASQAFVAWCNDAGGINGRKIDLEVRDAALLRAREVMTEACAQDFALVGGGLALDFQSVGVRTACGLTEFPGFANSVDDRESDHQVQALPAYKTQWPVTQYAQIAKAFPASIGKFGVMVTSAQLGSGRPFDQRLMDAIRPLGYNLTYKGDLPPPPVPVDNWRPYVEEMKARGVRVLDFEVTAEYLVPLLRTMRDVGWYPDAIILQANFYNPALLEAGDALRNTWLNQYVHPFELADRNAPTKQFMAIMDDKTPDWKHGGLAVNSFSAWLLFAKAAKACGAQLTRDCVERNGLAAGSWDGGGLHAPFKVDTKADPQPRLCGVLLQATPDGFSVDETRTGANEGIYHCSTSNMVKVAP